MSIAQRNEIEELKQRVATLEEIVKQLQASTPKPAPRETLTLEKRKSA